MKDVVKAPPLPGTPAHQALLRGIIEAYADDERMLANRRPWIARARDMGRVVRSGPGYHRRRRCGDRRCERGRGAVPTVGQSGALAVASRPGEVDVLLESLEGFSICYHSLGTTNAHIIDDLKIVGGRLDRAAIVAAGLVQSLPTRTPEVIASEALRLG